MALTTHEKRAFVRCLQLDAADSGISFYEAIKALMRARYDDVTPGRIVSASTVGGHSVSFSNVENAGLNQKDVLGFCSELIDLRDDSLTHLGSTATDDQQVAHILQWLQPARNIRARFDYLRTEQS